MEKSPKYAAHDVDVVEAAANETEKLRDAISPLVTMTLASPILCPSLSSTATSKEPGGTVLIRYEPPSSVSGAISG